MDLEKAVEKYKAGQESAFNLIYHETVSLVRFAIYTKIPNKRIIEDLIQDTYVKVSKLIFSYQSHNFKAWIYTLAKNIAIDYIKKKKEIVSDTVENFMDIHHTHPYLHYAIRHLDEIEREIFLMKVLCGHTTSKVAKIFDLKPSMVNQYYYQAKKKLKKCLEENI